VARIPKRPAKARTTTTKPRSTRSSTTKGKGTTRAQKAAPAKPTVSKATVQKSAVKKPVTTAKVTSTLKKATGAKAATTTKAPVATSKTTATAKKRTTTKGPTTLATGKTAAGLKISSPIKAKDFRGNRGPIGRPIKPKKPTEEDPLRLMEYVAAIRREFEAVALIAAPEEREVPQFQLAEVEVDMSYLVTKVDDDGVFIEIDNAKLSGSANNLVHRARLKFLDLEVGDQAREDESKSDD
jgi:hypothetical protein